MEWNWTLPNPEMFGASPSKPHTKIDSDEYHSLTEWQ